MHTCSRCEEPIAPTKRDDTQYCSKRCRDAAKKQRAKARDPERFRAKRREKERRARERDPEKVREQVRVWNRTRRAERRDAWMAKNGPCRQCGSWDQLEADHIDPSTKDPVLRGRAPSDVWLWSDERREPELAKCQVLCRPCHIEKSRAEARKVAA